MIGKGYFDSVGSQITFSLSENKGILYLSQHGVAPHTQMGPEIGVALGFAQYTWSEQAHNLAVFLGVAYQPPANHPGLVWK